MTVSGTLYAYTQLLKSDPTVTSITCAAQFEMGTCRGFRLGIPPLKARKDGRAWRVMKSICENVRADPDSK